MYSVDHLDWMSILWDAFVPLKAVIRYISSCSLLPYTVMQSIVFFIFFCLHLHVWLPQIRKTESPSAGLGRLCRNMYPLFFFPSWKNLLFCYQHFSKSYSGTTMKSTSVSSNDHCSKLKDVCKVHFIGALDSEPRDYNASQETRNAITLLFFTGFLLLYCCPSFPFWLNLYFFGIYYCTGGPEKRDWIIQFT